MTHKPILELLLAVLLSACAHDRANTQVQQPQQAQRAEGKSRSGGENAERVELPRKHHRGELASAQGVPSHEANRSEEASIEGESRAREHVPTADEQSNDDVDVDLTQRIRKAVMKDDALSFTAKNAQIVSRDGRVTLRGRVKTNAEREAIYQTALREAGAGHVMNELEADEK